jgi:hypothetical protein
MKLILVHGRSQQQKDPEELRLQWKTCLEAAWERAGLPWAEKIDIVFPFYGDDLDRMMRLVDAPLMTNILLRGDESVAGNDELRVEILAEIIKARGIPEDDVNAHLEGDALEKERAIERGPQNWRFVLAMLRALDQTPLGGKAIDAITRDVWVYLTFGGIQAKIDAVVKGAIDQEPCIVIAHSLGTIVAYNVLSRLSSGAPEIPLFLTVGSPLGIRAIAAQLPRPLGNPPGVQRWVNARDRRDVVALYPLDTDHFDILPAIEDFSNVDNFTENRHSIEGYLADPFVARCIHEALVPSR